MRPTALITGSSRGLGAAIARELAPTHDLLLGARSAQALEPICAELPGSTPLPLDLTDYDAVAAAASSITTLDVLVHNAGVADIGTIEESSVDQWRRTLEANVIAVAELTRVLLPALRAAGGHVVLINSGAGLRATPVGARMRPASSPCALSEMRCAWKSRHFGSPPFTPDGSTPTCSATSSRVRATSTTLSAS